MKKPKPVGYVVMFKEFDESGWLYGADPNVPGALVALDPPLLFATAADARRAIRLSEAAERLAAIRGEIVDTDFTERPSSVRVVPLYPAAVLPPERNPRTGTRVTNAADVVEQQRGA